jgi:hypothetical protein
MSNVTTVQPERLPALITRAAAALAQATTAAEILDATNQAKVAYEAAKLAARLSKIKEAHDEVVAACRKAMADALVIEAQAQCRLADAYDAAQERGEVATRSDGTAIRDHVPGENKVATITDIGLTHKQIHEARIVRDAEKKKPGLVQKTVADKLQAGSEPLRADVRRAAREAIAPPPPRPASPPPRPESPDPKSKGGIWAEAKADIETAERLGAPVRVQTWSEWIQEASARFDDRKVFDQVLSRMKFYYRLAQYETARADYFAGEANCGVLDDLGAKVDAAFGEVEWEDDDKTLEWMSGAWIKDEDDDGSE